MSTTVQESSIDAIVDQMDEIIQRCIREGSKLGYFAVLYRNVTGKVRDEIKAGYFDDGERMKRLVVVFAGRYLEAIHEYWQGGQPSRSWWVAFKAANLRSLIILQHLMLGMNAHINLDLAIATAQTAPGPMLPAIKNDFQKIMDILSDMIDTIEARLETVSPSFKIIDRIGGRTDEKIAGFAIHEAHDMAWTTAEKLAVATPEEFKTKLELHDELVSILARGISNPPGILMRAALFLIQLREGKNVPNTINALLK